jgi:hypothetical protein
VTHGLDFAALIFGDAAANSSKERKSLIFTGENPHIFWQKRVSLPMASTGKSKGQR